jgi:DNA gyrase subunit B
MEMNSNELWETTMNPKTRRMIKIDSKDLEDADKLFDIHMSSKCRDDRRKITMENSNKINSEELDI